MSALFFVHSPLVGPSSCRRVAAAAVAGGREVAVADLTGVAGEAGAWAEWYVDAALSVADELSGDIVVIGHSGAGVFLPTIAARLAGRHRATVFVDAVVPPAAGHHVTSPGLIEVLDRQTVDGRLNRWLEWWDDDVVAQILPDPADREFVVADMPRLPRAFYDDPVAVPDGWSSGTNGYVQLSPAYDADVRVAEEHGWPVKRIDGTHLSTVTDPDAVLAAVDRVLDRLTR